MEKRVYKTHEGCVDIRDYERNECLKNKESFIIFFNNEKMTLSPREVKWSVKRFSKTTYKGDKSVNEPDYLLVSYLWNPDN